MTKNERSLQWVIAGIFFVVCFAFFQWIYPNHLFFKEQMRIFLYTTDYFISFWDEPAWLSCYVGNFLIQFFHLTVIGPLIVTCVLLLLWYYSMRVLRKFGNGNMVSIYALFPVALEWGLICRLSYSIASTLTLIFVLWLFLGYIRIKNKRTSVWVAFILLPIIYSMVGSRLFVFSLMVIFYEGAKNRKRWWFWLSLLLSSYLYPLFMPCFSVMRCIINWEIWIWPATGRSKESCSALNKEVYGRSSGWWRLICGEGILRRLENT